MHIKEITLEGFKSYAQRVTLTNFDQAFNAITGLNGSGKSNILDSICFVLRISQLQRVSAAGDRPSETCAWCTRAGNTSCARTWRRRTPDGPPPRRSA
jgi:recombinational DNA repair ATPase RecF